MTELYTVPAEQKPCVVHKYHGTSRPLRTVFHHIQPLGWGGPDVDTNLVATCDNGHYSIHRILDWLRKEDGLALRSGLGNVDQLLRLRPPFGGSQHEIKLAREGYRRWVVAGRPRGSDQS